MGTTYLTDGDDLTSVANAIRAKSGGSSQLAFPAGFVSEIQAIPTGGTDHLKTATVTLTQDYAVGNTAGPAVKALLDAAIGTDYWIAVVSEAPSSMADMQYIVCGAVKFSSLNVPNMQGYDTDHISTSYSGSPNVAFWRTYTTQTIQGWYPGGTNARAYAGMKYQIWGWDAT